MATRKSTIPAEWTLEDLWNRVGKVPLGRIRLNPPPGTATEKDVLRLLDRHNRLFELVDGILVEKVMGLREAGLALAILRPLGDYVEQHDLGFVSGADSTIRLMPKLVRIPDGAFISWKQLPSKHYPNEPIPDLAPEIVLEILSESNTVSEMEQKLREYCFAGVKLVWIIDPDKRTVTAYTAPDQARVFKNGAVLDGSPVLPDFTLPLKKLFARLSPDSRKKRTRT